MKQIEREEQEKKDKSVEEKKKTFVRKKTFDFCNTVFINSDISKTSVHVYSKLAILSSWPCLFAGWITLFTR